MPNRDPAKLTKVSLSLPFGMGKAEWESDPAERKAAWALYVELITRVAVQKPEGEFWLYREALSSLYSLFDSTRGILREGGPTLGGTRNSVGGIAMAVLNVGLRPFLSKWHPVLLAWESKRGEQIGVWEHESNWPEAERFRSEMEALRSELRLYAKALATMCGITVS
ncbi:hypothetical protein [Granulicella aggregans]|jgi:hypothetical protein|uniref:hypothetical protein n=1 Tax=Granulicella aggregans TaxID=474949 RepID=UPI0021E0069B|nr:hypothetical protein [Granulicella aggregans]